MEMTGNDFFRRIVLVVDDEAVNRNMLGAILEQKYDVLYAENGRQALDTLKGHGSLISLVVLDLLMPELDGYAVLASMQENSELSKIPVIVLTSEKDAEVKSLQMGAADFLSKPYDLPEVILARVKHAIKLYEYATIIQATEHDRLTRLYTSEYFFQYAEQYEVHNRAQQMDALAINVNRFHLLNELRGREFGDMVLCTLADGVREFSERTGGIACRANADTFYLYTAHQAEYTSLLESLQKKLSAVLPMPEINLRLGMYASTSSPCPLVQRFDRALYACNSLRNAEQGKPSVAVYDEAMLAREVSGAGA